MSHKTLKLYKLDPENELNFSCPLYGFYTESFYVVLGELESTGHYILMEYPCNKIIPGIVSLERFIPADTEDYSFILQ